MFQITKIEDRNITLSDGRETYKIGRFCTHEGADLSLGMVKDGMLLCPWHGLAFNLRTGEQACRTLKNLSCEKYAQA